MEVGFSGHIETAAKADEIEKLIKKGLSSNNNPPHRFLPDLVLVDVNMPEISGIELIRKLRELEGVWSLVPIVILSTSNSQKDIKDAYRAGANAYMQKSMKFETLKENINDCLNFFGRSVLPPEID